MSDLAPYASDPMRSLGRQYGTETSPTRTPYQRDRDRIIHSTAFRRLQHKTQVFLHHEGSHYRTRLTHTLEVSQIARSMARALSLNEDLAEAIALAHDLGHPPFGHAGERVLNEKMQLFAGFDHNMQALRVVTLLESRYAEHEGLNLTWETLEGILKHNGPLLDANGLPAGKYKVEGLPFGWQDLHAVQDLRLDTFPSLEAQVAAVADDVAYNAHDMDDAIRAGLLAPEDFSDVPFAGDVLREVQAKWPHLDRIRLTHELQRRMITRMIEDVIKTSAERLKLSAPVSAEEVRKSDSVLIDFSSEMGANVRILKAFLFERVYRSEHVMRPVRQGEAVVARLFDHFLETGEMPGRWRETAQNAVDRSARARVVCDFVAGMTDPFAIDLYERLFDDRPDFR